MISGTSSRFRNFSLENTWIKNKKASYGMKEYICNIGISKGLLSGIIRQTCQKIGREKRRCIKG